jgi:hypothetical protein
MENLKYYVPASILILIAIMIVAVPEILVAFLAALIIMAGIGALYIGHMIRKSDIELRNTDGWILDGDLYGRRFVSAPVLRRWFREF